MDLNDLMSAPTTNALIVLNLLISGYALFVDDSVIDKYALNVRAIFQDKQYYRLISGNFLHVDPFHFLFNMLTLFSFGRAMEGIIGPEKFLILYFGAMLVADVAALYFQRRNPDYTAIGASGAVTGVVFSFCIFAPFAPLGILFLPFGIPAILFAFIYTAYSMFAMSSSNLRGGIAHEAHLGGAVGGIFITMVLAPEAINSLIQHLT